MLVYTIVIAIYYAQRNTEASSRHGGVAETKTSAATRTTLIILTEYLIECQRLLPPEMSRRQQNLVYRKCKKIQWNIFANHLVHKKSQVPDETWSLPYKSCRLVHKSLVQTRPVQEARGRVLNVRMYRAVYTHHRGERLC